MLGSQGEGTFELLCRRHRLPPAQECRSRVRRQTGSIREISLSCGVASSTVGNYLLRAEAARLGWPLPEGMGEAELEARWMAITTPREAGTPALLLPDWGHIHAELRRPNVTLRLLWQEYIRNDPTGLKYSRFCECYAQWRKTLEPSMRQAHVPGEKMFVDWAGQQVPTRNAADGTSEPSSLFVAALGASGKIFARAFPDQKLHSRIGAHVCSDDQFSPARRRQSRGAAAEQDLDAESVDLHWTARFHAGSWSDPAPLDGRRTSFLALFRNATGSAKQLARFDPQGFGEVNDLKVGDPADLGFDFCLNPSARVPAELPSRPCVDYGPRTWNHASLP